MSFNNEFVTIPVDRIDFDSHNPRIKMALEKYGDQLTPDRIHFALRSATDGSHATSSYSGLRDSIRASRGVMDPIRVIADANRYTCIDGNTRLAIYKQFIREELAGDWSKIKAIVLHDPPRAYIERVRISAHLVGAREWPAYEKARYLHHLRNVRLMDYNELIALCGGNKTEIERQIDAFHDMNEHYRNLVDDTAFHIDRFSGFVELQRPNIKEAIFSAGMTLNDFGEWIKDGKIYRMADVRQLPRVLRDEDAKHAFLSGGARSIEQAVRILDDRVDTGTRITKITLQDATVVQLANVLSRRIKEMPYSEILSLRARGNDQTVECVQALDDLQERLQQLIGDVSPE